MTYEFGKKKRVFVDWDFIEPGYGLAWGGDGPASWEMPYGIKLAVHSPRIDWEPLVKPDQPWEHDIEMHHSMFEDDGLYRLYYRIWDAKGRNGGHAVSPAHRLGITYTLAYAESEDGVNWIKPNLGTHKFNGSTNNNIIHLGKPAGSPVVFKDPSADDNERYKLVFRSGDTGGGSYVWGATSSDGLHWDVIEKPIMSGYSSDTHNIVAYSEEKGKYVGYWRGRRPVDGESPQIRRTIAYAETNDFRTWPRPKTVVGPDVHDSPDTDFYTNSYTPWPGADAHLLFPAVYERRKDLTELHMFTSRDGIAWQRISRDPVSPRGPPGSGMEAGVYAGVGMVSIKPGEWSMPIAPQSHTHNQCQYPEGVENLPHHGFVCLATWREDGFTSIEAESEGSFSTVPFVLKGGKLELSTWSNYGGAIKVELVEVLNERSRDYTPPVAGRSFDNCDVITGDNLHHKVTWNGESDISAWSGKLVRLRFKFLRSNLYAMQIK